MFLPEQLRKSYVIMDKTKHMDAFLISDFARVDCTKNVDHRATVSISPKKDLLDINETSSPNNAHFSEK